MGFRHARAVVVCRLRLPWGSHFRSLRLERPTPPRGHAQSGLVALTFDDGPAAGLTPKLLDILTERRVPATFFMVGERIDSAPRTARRVAARGFGIANHTYHHEQLTRLSNSAIRATIRRTRRAAADHGVRMSRLVRPPYGAMDARVRSVITGMGLVPVLWTVDPQDWRTGRSSDAIASSVLAQLRPRRTNIVLLHDGVANSPRSVAAVPRVIRTARARGYCFARLGPGGTPVPPVPAVSLSDARVTERTGSRAALAFTVRLDRPTSRRTSVLVTTVDGAARVGRDYVARRVRVYFPVGVTRAVVRVSVVGDRLDEAAESMRVRLSSPSGVAIRRRSAVGTIRDDDAPPVVRLSGSSVAEPETGSVAAPVRVTLSAPEWPHRVGAGAHRGRHSERWRLHPAGHDRDVPARRDLTRDRCSGARRRGRRA